MNKLIHPTHFPRPRGYTHGVLCAPGRILYIAGQVAFDKDARIVSADFATQFLAALDNVIDVTIARLRRWYPVVCRPLPAARTANHIAAAAAGTTDPFGMVLRAGRPHLDLPGRPQSLDSQRSMQASSSSVSTGLVT